MKTVVLIPALDPNEQLCKVVQGCINLGLTRIVVVNDGSTSDHDPLFATAEALGAHVLRHETNRGKGAALKTGIRGALAAFPDMNGIVTADADGQHAPADILCVAQALAQQSQGLVLGARDFPKGSTPSRSLMGNRISSWLFFLMTGMRCRDTQTGLRGIARAQLDLALDTPGERYEFEMNFLVEAARKKLPITMIPIQTIYFNKNAASHFRTIRDSALIYQRPLKYAAVALGSCVVDLGLFTLLSQVVFSRTSTYIWTATIIARCVSGLFNFRMNQIWSFQPKQRSVAQFWKYLVLFFSVMVVSGAVVSRLQFLPLPLTVVKVIVDVILFFLNYQVQRRWVFAEKR
ncbi:MAG: bifunctional glycosyltransferase family 2/GtrA family protein [Oscillospiraceae bacterium]|nr:bifunctional glycosyltransferase family 2/GtrA family protein [Oscillospiraceae bacterium]